MSFEKSYQRAVMLTRPQPQGQGHNLQGQGHNPQGQGQDQDQGQCHISEGQKHNHVFTAFIPDS